MMASEQSSRRREGAGEAGSGGNSRHSAGPAMTETGQGCRFDISYLRSLEGILRAISFVRQTTAWEREGVQFVL